MDFSLSRVLITQSDFSCTKELICACEIRIGARIVSVPLRSMMSAMVLRLLRMSLSICICINNLSCYLRSSVNFLPFF